MAIVLYTVILRIARNFLKTRQNIKTSNQPFYHINLKFSKSTKATAVLAQADKNIIRVSKDM